MSTSIRFLVYFDVSAEFMLSDRPFPLLDEEDEEELNCDLYSAFSFNRMHAFSYVIFGSVLSISRVIL